MIVISGLLTGTGISIALVSLAFLLFSKTPRVMRCASVTSIGVMLAAIGYGIAPQAYAATPTNANVINEKGVGGLGQVLTNLTISTQLTVPTGARHAWVSVWDNPVCWTMDNGTTAATANSGGKWPVGFVAKLDNAELGGYSELKSYRFINCDEGPTELRVAYTRAWRAGD